MKNEEKSRATGPGEDNGLVVDALRKPKAAQMIDRLHDFGIRSITIAKSGPLVTVRLVCHGTAIEAHADNGDVSTALWSAGFQARAIHDAHNGGADA